MAVFQPHAIHWEHLTPEQLPEQVFEHDVSSTLAITYGVPRRSIKPSPRVDRVPAQSRADATEKGPGLTVVDISVASFSDTSFGHQLHKLMKRRSAANSY